MAGLTAIKRKGFAGGGSDTWGPGASSPGTTKSGGNVNTASSGNDNREQYIVDYHSQGKVKGGGKKVRVPDAITGGPTYEDIKVTPKTITDQKNKYEKQFYDKGKVPPIGWRPTSWGTKVDQFNKQKRLNYINHLIKERRNKFNKGLIDYQDEFGQFTNVTDFDPLSSYINQVQSVKDLVNQGFYSKDGRFSKGDIPDFNAVKPPGLMGVFADKFGGPITSDRLNELMGEINKLENLKTTKGLEGTTFNKLMETYQPNRFKLENPDQGGAGQERVILPYLPPEEEEEAEEEKFAYRFGDEQKVGADVTQGFYASQGGRVPRAGGGIMNAVPRQGYFLGKIVKGVGKAIGSVADAAGKVLKSDFGKAALMAGAFYYGGGGGNPFTAAGRAKFSPTAFFSKAFPKKPEG